MRNFTLQTGAKPLSAQRPGNMQQCATETKNQHAKALLTCSSTTMQLPWLQANYCAFMGVKLLHLQRQSFGVCDLEQCSGR